MIGFDRFTERAQEAATRAYEIMLRYQHTQLDTEHILLALLEQADGLIPEVLQEQEIDAKAIMQRIDDMLKASSKAAGARRSTAGLYHAARQAADGSGQRRGHQAT